MAKMFGRAQYDKRLHRKRHLMIPTEFWLVFLFALGACVGSFLNVVVYRLPREMSLIRPGSQCTSCGRSIAWYDNIPIASWFLLRGKCRHCGARFSIRYAMVELFTAVLFVGFYWAYFIRGMREAFPGFNQGGYLVYAGHMVLVAALLVSSLIDREHWVIELRVCHAAALAGVALSVAGPYCLTIDPADLPKFVPYGSAKTAALALGAGIGLLLGLLLLRLGVLKQSFADWEQAMAEAQEAGQSEPEINLDIRREMAREIGFLLPAIVLATAAACLLTGKTALGAWWADLIAEQKWLAGLLGSVFGFMIGGAVVWATRILGSLAFGREAMGLGDVHLMAAVGAVLGWLSPVLAFFVAPFLGVGVALGRLLVKREREIWYGPFLSAATVIVMLFYDPIVERLLAAFWRR